MEISEASVAIVRCGTEQPDVPGQILTAGPMSVEFDNGQLRYLRVNGIEVLRAVGFLIRDENWGTYVPVISELNIEQRAAGFSVSFHAVCQRDDQQIEFDATVEGKPNGDLSFACTAIPKTDFLTARTGFVVLHPLKGVAGHAVRVEHVDGSIVNDKFPEAVDPIQPFLNIRSLTHDVTPGLSATVLMQGDTFEMEDHRNWTDASFKTYVRPLALPWPYTLKSGEPVQQSITVSLLGKPVTVVESDEQGVVQISLGKDLAGLLPPLGLGMPAEEIDHTLKQSAFIKELAPQFLVCQFDPRENDGLKQLNGYKSLCEKSGAKALLEVVVESVDNFRKELQQLADWVDQSGLELMALSVVPVGDLKSVLPGGDRPPAPNLDELYAVARAAFPDVHLGGGMLSFFTELNRKRVPVGALDYVQNTTCPIVHACDDRSVMETLEALPYQVVTARTFLGDRPHWVGPSGIGCRDNPHGATWTPNPENGRVCLTKHDPRQRGLFGAAWTLGYVATLARAGVAAVSIGSPTGPLGMIYRQGPFLQPWFDSLDKPAVFPAFHVFRGLAHDVGCSLIQSESSRPEAVQHLAYRRDDSTTVLWLANLTSSEQFIDIDLPVNVTITGNALDENSFVQACTDPLSFGAASHSMPRDKIGLTPYGVVILTIIQ